MSHYLSGMAILSMCFSLIQEEIVAKFKWVGEKIGIIEKNKDQDEEEEEEDDEMQFNEDEDEFEENMEKKQPYTPGPPPPARTDPELDEHPKAREM